MSRELSIMESEILRRRAKPASAEDLKVDKDGKSAEGHPGGDIKHGGSVEILRLLLMVAYFLSSCFSYVYSFLVLEEPADKYRIVITQFIGVPLYWYNKHLYYSYMALTKQSFGIFVTTSTQWWSPTVVRISGDASVAGQLRKTPDGRVECHFPDRMVMIANHQVRSR